MTIYSKLSYLQKHRFVERQIKSVPNSSLGMVVVIPCHAEPDIIPTLASLKACTKPKSAVEVLIVVNASILAPQEIHAINQQTLDQIASWKAKNSFGFDLFALHFPSLPKKHAGVGLARKIGMDEAVDRLEQANNAEGAIICLDADSKVAPNYLIELEKHFRNNHKTQACALHFEHPLSGDDFPNNVYEGIAQYELFLRYYIEGLRHSGYPYAFHTIGSSMAVRSNAYQKMGGMNRRKAGEDFYFLHKFMPGGHLSELTTTQVIPSPRPSDRVPFGTGKAIGQFLDEGNGQIMAYIPQTFDDLKAFVRIIPQLYDRPCPELPKVMQAFLDSSDFSEKLEETRKHVTSQTAFAKRFYDWFDGLKVLKFVHFARDHFYGEVSVSSAAKEFLVAQDFSIKSDDPVELLNVFREKQRNV